MLDRKQNKKDPAPSAEEKKQTEPQEESKSGKHEKKQPKGERPHGFWYQAGPVILLAIGTFLGICLYTDTGVGVAGVLCQRAFFGLVGWAAYVVPPLLLYAALRFRHDYCERSLLRKTVFAGFGVIMVAVMIYTFGIPDAQKQQFDLFYTWGLARHGGGVLGNYIGFGLNYTVAKPGTVIFMLLFIVLFALVFFDFHLGRALMALFGCIRRGREQRSEKRRVYAEQKARSAARADRNSAANAFYGESAGTVPQTEDAADKKETGDLRRTPDIGQDPFLFPTGAADSGRQFYNVEEDDTVFDAILDDSHAQQPEKNTPKKEKNMSADLPLTAELLPEEERDAEESFTQAAKEAKGRRIRELAQEFEADDPFFTVEKMTEELPHDEGKMPKSEGRYAFSFEDEKNFPSVEIISTDPIPGTDEIPQPVVDKLDVAEKPTPVSDGPVTPTGGAIEDPLFDDGMDEDVFDRTPVFRPLPEEPSPKQETPVAPKQPIFAQEELPQEPVPPAEDGLQINQVHVISHSGIESFEDKTEAKPSFTYQFPPLSLLHEEEALNSQDSDEEIKDKAERLLSTLQSFNVQARISCVSRGPRLTRYELVPEVGVRIRSIENLVNEIAMNLEAVSVRIEAPIPGKAAIGVEVPNNKYSTVRLRGLLDTDEFRTAPGKTTVCLGVDVVGVPVFADIDKMPHLLVAGATGMGKSVCINSILVSLLYKARPDEVKLILIDPKKVEFKSYSNIPHLLVPVVTDAQKAAGALSWAVNEMERRYDIIEEAGVRNIKAYNKSLAEHPERERIPQIVIVIDELHDLMMQAPDAVEDAICRIAQKARAAGILLIIGTQRPSVNVITGVIKANIPSRIAFHVAAQVDSRTILDAVGAEKLLNDGDMLFLCPGMKMLTPKRIQGAFLDDDEVNRVAEYLRTHSSGVVYDEEIMADMERESEKCNKDKKGQGAMDLVAGEGGEGGEEELFYRAVEVALENGKISTSLLQRKLSLGFGKAARLIDRMQEMGIVSPPNGQKPRDVLITVDDYRAMRLRNDE